MGEQLQPEALEERLRGGGRWTRVVAVRPTGESVVVPTRATHRETCCHLPAGVRQAWDRVSTSPPACVPRFTVLCVPPSRAAGWPYRAAHRWVPRFACCAPRFTVLRIPCPRVRAAGWSYRPSGKLEVREQGSVTVLGVPYSEHSSFPELQ